MKAARLLKVAGRLYDEPENGLAAAVRPEKGFSGGGEWMRLALEVIRGKPVPKVIPSFQWLGVAKYAFACLAFCLTWLGLLIGCPWWLLAPASIAAFYAVEVQFVFLFPLAIDGHLHPWRDARIMTGNIQTLNAMAVVLPLAAVMLAGGFFGRGFVRCWCLGCLSVVLWYEEERTSRQGLVVRAERVRGSAPLRLLWVTDLHLTRRSTVSLGARLCRTARRLKPELIILGGDIVEERSALPCLGRVLRLLSRIAPTHVLPGNHDRRAGLDAFRDIVTSNFAFWHDAPGFALGQGATRQIVELSEATAPGGSLVFVHDPSLLDGFITNWCAAFAGHLHGGQAILWRHGGLEYPGAWLSRWNGPRFETPRGTVIVSRGVADTLPLRWNCPKEIILCEIC